VTRRRNRGVEGRRPAATARSRQLQASVASGTIERWPEHALILRIERPQRCSNVVPEASDAAFDCYAQQSDEGASADRQLRTAQCGRTPRMLGAITFHFLHHGPRSILSRAPVRCPAIICSHSPFKRRARPDRMCARRRALFIAPSVLKMKL
jgi:hypothetical protein